MKKKRMLSKSLLIKTADNRCFFTEEKHFPLLIEFGRTFNAEISVVKTKEPIEPLSLGSLARHLCSQEERKYPDYEIIEVKLKPSQKPITREEKRKKSDEIAEYIRKELLAGNYISVKGLGSKFKNYSESTLSKHLARTKRKLQSEGNWLTRTPDGQYRIANEEKPNYYEL